MGKEGALAFALAMLIVLGVARALPPRHPPLLTPIDARSGGACRVLGLPIDLNTATEADLEALPGVGPALAGRILAYRAAHGPLRRLDELENVSGIGEGKLRLLAGRASVRAER